jgi:hypothetical protein
MPYGGALIMWALKILGVGYSAWLGLLNLFLGGGLFFRAFDGCGGISREKDTRGIHRYAVGYYASVAVVP